MCDLILVEPDPAYRRLLCALLQVLGHTSSEVVDTEGCLARLRERGAGVLLAWDPDRPEGLEFVRQLRADPQLQNTPVILMPTTATRAQVVHAVAVGIQGMLLKSQIEPGRLRVALRRAMPGQGEPGVHAPTPSGQGVGAPTQAAPATGSAPRPAVDAPDAAVPLPAAQPAPQPGTLAATAATGLRDLKPIVARAGLLERLGEIGQTKALPPTLTQLMRMMRNPNCSIDSLAEVISHDQSVAVKILKLANSAVYSRGDAVTSVKEAVLRIGLERIGQAVVNIGVVDQFGTADVSAHFNFVHFWEHSICCGLLASGLGEATGLLDPDKAFALGLLHDVGRMVLIEHFHEEYEEVLETAARLDLPLEQVESRLLLLNHAAVVERVLHNWGIPKDLIGPMANHHLSAANMREHAGKQLQETAILALANRLSHALLVGSSGNDAVYPTEALCKLLRVSATTIAEVIDTAEEQTRQIKFALLMVSDQQPWPSVLTSRRAELETKPRPLYIGDDEGLDAFRMVASRLSAIGEEKPNLAIVRLDAKRQVVRLGVMLAAREEELRLPPLPTMVISPGGDLELDHGQMSRRRVVKVPAPLTMRRLIATINGLLAEGVGQQAAA